MATTEERIKAQIAHQTTIDEVHEIMFVLRGKDALTDGDYRARHLGAILEYFQHTKRENIKMSVSKLALKIGLNVRTIKESYIEGMISWGIIQLEKDCSEWYWVGLSAIENKRGELKKHDDQ